MKVAVITDSGSNYREEHYDVPGIYVVPLTISDGEKTYLMGEEISVQETYKMVAEGKMLTTSMPPLGLIEELFAKLKEEYDLLFAVPICSGLSGCIGAMQSAAKEVDVPFEYIDCYSTASNQLYLALTARKMFDLGMDVATVKETLQKAAEDSVTFVLPVDLNHLVRGGRLTRRAALLAGLFKINPVLIVNKESGGTNDVYDKVRTLRKAEERVIQYFKEHNVDEHCRICMTHVSDEKAGMEFYNMMKEAFPNSEIYFCDLVSVVGVHTGIGCLACQYIRKLDVNP